MPAHVLMRTVLLVCLPLLCLQQAHADLINNIRQAGKVRIAIASAVPPFNFLDENKQLIGSDVDTAYMLARDLGVKPEIVRISNSERVTVLKERRADLVISALSITPERELEIAFSVPYARIAVVIAAPQTMKLSSMLDLNGKNVGVLAASSNLAHLRKAASGAKPIEYPENDKISNGYLAGDFEIMSAPESIVISTNHLHPKQALQVQFTQMEFDVAVGMPKGEKALRDWINQWVVQHLQDRSLGEIYRKHHGHSLPSSILPAADRDKQK